MRNLQAWISACRLRTLPLSISGAIVGSGIAYSRGFFDSSVFALTIATTLSLQILSNLANDYGDGIKGTDNENRIGPERALQSGKISPKQMRNAIVFNVILCLILVISLIYSAFGSEQFTTSMVFIILGILAIIAAIKYTVGASAYGYRALGDVMVFLFFGWLSVLGSYFLYSKQIDFLILFPASTIGLLSTGVLNLNNMRDIESDRRSKKQTLAGYFGFKMAKLYQQFLVGVAMLLIVFYLFLDLNSSMYLILIAFVPLLLHMNSIRKIKSPLEYDPQLKVLALSTFLLAIIFSICTVLI
jgi:1,4-dihydroxy-2-naphthoate octaprenyltransferase